MSTDALDACLQPCTSPEKSNGLLLMPPSSPDRSPHKPWCTEPHSPSSRHLLEVHSDYDGGKEKPRKQGRTKTRTINHITLGFIAYFAVAAGPFGVEDAVRAAGPYPVLLAVVLLPFTWGLPQALMVGKGVLSLNGQRLQLTIVGWCSIDR